ncbi:MAG: CheR family methyltransferase, partial [Planctomycetota bacterium]
MLEKILMHVKQCSGTDLHAYRRSMIERRLAARMRTLGLDDPAVYLSRLETDPSECDSLIDTIGVNVSSFFRNPFVFEMIRKQVLPEIMERKKKTLSREIRIWSAGCGAGEEAYSMAMLIHMALKNEAEDWTPYIFATDIDGKALNRASEGIYRRDDFRTTKLGIMDAYVRPLDDNFQVSSTIR